MIGIMTETPNDAHHAQVTDAPTRPRRNVVAGGMSFAARARRLDEPADIIVLERGAHVSFAN